MYLMSCDFVDISKVSNSKSKHFLLIFHLEILYGLGYSSYYFFFFPLSGIWHFVPFKDFFFFILSVLIDF